MKNNQCWILNPKISEKDIAAIAILRAQRRSQCKRLAREEIAHQRAIEELDRVLLRQFRDWL